MRDLICAAAAGALALAACDGALAKPTERPKPAAESRAASAEAHGVRANFRSEAGKGYDARSRRMAECLASYPAYDPAIDRIRVRPGVTRRCYG